MPAVDAHGFPVAGSTCGGGAFACADGSYVDTPGCAFPFGCRFRWYTGTSSGPSSAATNGSSSTPSLPTPSGWIVGCSGAPTSCAIARSRACASNTGSLPCRGVLVTSSGAVSGAAARRCRGGLFEFDACCLSRAVAAITSSSPGVAPSPVIPSFGSNADSPRGASGFPFTGFVPPTSCAIARSRACASSTGSPLPFGGILTPPSGTGSRPSSAACSAAFCCAFVRFGGSGEPARRSAVRSAHTGCASSLPSRVAGLGSPAALGGGAFVPRTGVAAGIGGSAFSLRESVDPAETVRAGVGSAIASSSEMPPPVPPSTGRKRVRARFRRKSLTLPCGPGSTGGLVGEVMWPDAISALVAASSRSAT